VSSSQPALKLSGLPSKIMAKIIWILSLLILAAGPSDAAWRPVVLMHGLQASAEAMSHAQGWIESEFPGIYVHNVEIGDGKHDSMFMPFNQQIEVFAAVVKNDSKLAGGFNLIGHSQGGMVARGYVERYNDPPVYNLISWAGPQGGQFGVPDFNWFCPDAVCPWLNVLFDALMNGFPSKEVQNTFSFATYWKDPFHIKDYERLSVFLADVNNEREVKNSTYKKNLMSVNTFLLIDSANDTIVIPKTSPWFDFYKDGSERITVPLNETEGYQQDWIGLRTLNEAGKLLFHTVPCGHEDIPRDVCREYYELWTRPLLNNTM